jgi:hypothetical protein
MSSLATLLVVSPVLILSTLLAIGFGLAVRPSEGAR